MTSHHRNAFFLQAWVVSFLNITPAAGKACKSFFHAFLGRMENCALLSPLLSRQKFLERWLKLLWLSLFTFQAPCKAFKEQGGSPASFPILSEYNYCQRKWNLPWWNLAKLQSWLIRSCNFCPWSDLFLELAMWPPTTSTVLERTLESINETKYFLAMWMQHLSDR